MEVKVSVSCEVSYHLIGFGDMSGNYTPKEYNTDISHEIQEGIAIDKDGIVISVAITIINLDK